MGNIVKEFIFSDNGWFNKENSNLYSLVQTDNTSITDFTSSTYFIELYYDGTNYSKIKYIILPFNISNAELNDSIHYDTGE